jgi:uncharacterized protein YggE
MNLRTLLTAFVVGLSLAAAAPSYAQPVAVRSAPETSVVSATATARVYRAPDYLDIFLAVEIDADTAQDAQTRCATTMEAVLVALKTMNLEKYEPQTGTVTLQPRYTERYNQPSERKIIGYTAMNSVRVRTADLKATARIIDGALKAGANRVDGVSFGIKEYLAAREEALAMAVKAARRKAEVMAGALDLSLGRVLNLSESSGPRYYGGMNRLAQVQAANSAGEAAPGEESVVPGQIEVVVDVTVSFELEKK